jgi:hypothetical protein
LIRQKFKFDEPKIKEIDDLLDNEESDEDIFMESKVFGYNKEDKKQPSKDLTNVGLMQKNNRKLFFELLNKETNEDENLQT